MQMDMVELTVDVTSLRWPLVAESLLRYPEWKAQSQSGSLVFSTESESATHKSAGPTDPLGVMSITIFYVP
jgi:hypothetical protein